jgi:hypothetical protein
MSGIDASIPAIWSIPCAVRWSRYSHETALTPISEYDRSTIAQREPGRRRTFSRPPVAHQDTGGRVGAKRLGCQGAHMLKPSSSSS